MSIFRDPRERGKFLKFSVVGAAGSVVDFGIFNLLASLLHVPAVLASIVSFSLAVVNNFIWNRLWTYPETREIPIAKQLTQFTAVSVAGLAIRTPLFAITEKLFIAQAAKYLPNVLTPTIVGHNLALAFVILVVLLWNFFINRKWTFKTPPNRNDSNHESPPEA